MINANASDSGNITNPTAEPYVENSVLTVVFADLNTRQPNFWANYYYWVYYAGGGSSNFSIALFSKDDSVVKVYKNYNDSSTWYLQKWGSSNRIFYTYNKTTGAFVSTQTLTTTTTTTITNWTIFSNIPVYIYTSLGQYVILGYNRFIPAENLPPGSAEDNTDYGWWGALFDSLAGWIVNPIVNFWNSMGFGDMFTSLANSIGAFFSPLATNIGTSISGLFIPTQQDMNDFYSDFNGFLDTKLGFLWYPIDWSVTTLNATLSVPEKSQFPLGTLFGGTLAIDMTTLEDYIPSLWSLLRTFAQFMTAYALVSALLEKIKSKLNGGE